MRRAGRQAMERNRWETAIRCLEIALHPGTSDDELIAAVNGFRRTADGTPLGEICIAFAAGDHSRRGESGLDRQNRELRHRLAERERTLIAAERRARDLEEALLAARREADEATQALAELRAAYRDMAERARRETSPAAVQPGANAQSPRPAFRTLLTEARLRVEPWMA
jgi:hypothetical protein